jgi:glycolate oxidase FAD binding subunit
VDIPINFAPKFVPDSVDEVQEIVKYAVYEHSLLLPIGGGVQIDAGCLTDDVDLVSTHAFNQIIEYSPRDLVVTAGAGMTLTELQGTLAEHGQTLPLEVAFPDKQTLGGIAASKAPSLIRASHGSIRDWLIGCHVITGSAELVVAGGKVVKNVAGYDLPKLYCGSWGSLGIITQVALKLAPLPKASKLLLMTLSTERNSEELLDALARSAQSAFTYLLNTRAARQILGADTPDAQFLAVGFDGHPEAIEAMSREAAGVAAPYVFQTIDLPSQVAVKFRIGLRDLSASFAPLRLRSNILPSQVGAFARMLEWTANRAGLDSIVFADANVGIVWARIYPRKDEEPASEDHDDAANLRWMRLLPDLRDKCARVGGLTVIETMPDCWRDAGYPKWSPETPELAWTKKIKVELDPHGIFAGNCMAGAGS